MRNLSRAYRAVDASMTQNHSLIGTPDANAPSAHSRLALSPTQSRGDSSVGKRVGDALADIPDAIAGETAASARASD